MKVLAFSDVHHSRARSEALVAMSREADLVIGAGDFCNMRQGLAEALNLFFGIKTPFVLIPGNAESHAELIDAAHAGWTVLHGEAATVAGLRIFGLGYGIPPTPFGSWSCDMTEAGAAAALAECDAADILVTHSPPFGLGDVTSQGTSVGSTAIEAAIHRIQPHHAVFGHIHDSWGAVGQIGRTAARNLGPAGVFLEVAA